MNQPVVLFDQDHQSHIELLAQRFDVIKKLDSLSNKHASKNKNEAVGPRFVLQFLSGNLSLLDRSQPKIKPIFVDFAEGKNAHRSQLASHSNNTINQSFT